MKKKQNFQNIIEMLKTKKKNFSIKQSSAEILASCICGIVRYSLCMTEKLLTAK